MASPERFDRLSDGLREAVAAHPDLTGLVLLGSASSSARSRRDEWSDHDFFAIVSAGRGTAVRPDLTWLPEPDAIATTAREGEIGFVALYDDGHVFEFALAELSELDGALAEDATVVVDDPAGGLAALIDAARERVASHDPLDPVQDVRLVLVKLLIGTGRARRGEVLAAGQLVRTWAVKHLVRALRGRFPERSSDVRDAIDPFRRFEADFPDVSARIAHALERPVDDAGHALFAITRETLEPGWAEFPTRAADAVAARMEW